MTYTMPEIKTLFSRLAAVRSQIISPCEDVQEPAIVFFNALESFPITRIEKLIRRIKKANNGELNSQNITMILNATEVKFLTDLADEILFLHGSLSLTLKDKVKWHQDKLNRETPWFSDLNKERKLVDSDFLLGGLLLDKNINEIKTKLLNKEVEFEQFVKDNCK